MKINSFLNHLSLNSSKIHSISRIMKASALLLFAGTFSLMAETAHSQTSIVTISRTNAPIEVILDDIESQTEYLFIYKKNVNVEEEKTVEVTEVPVSTVLDELFYETNVKYKQRGNYIFLSPSGKGTSIVASTVPNDASQDKKQVTGIIRDRSGEPLVGVSVIIKGTTNGTATDFDGKFTMEAGDGDVLEISYIGFKEVNIPAQFDSPIVLFMDEDTEMLEETVVVGYGVQKKSDLTGSISSVTSESMENRTSPTVGHALQGKIAGVQILQSSGAPGSSATIRIRGYSSNSSSDPLYIVDGLKVNNIDFLDTESIDSIEILKDAASAAIYGAEAGNGVVLITTKTGSKVKSGRIFYNMQYTFQSLAKNPEIMNAKQYIDFMTSAEQIAQSSIDANYDGHTDTDWVAEYLTTGVAQKHTLGFQNGGDSGNLFVSLTYSDNDGIAAGARDTFNRYGSQVNASQTIKPWMKVGLTNTIDYGITRGASGINSVFRIDPLFPVSYSSGNIPGYVSTLLNAGYKVPQDADGNYYGISMNTSDQINPFISRDITDSYTQRMNVNGTFYADFTPIKNLTITSRFGYRIGNSYTYNYGDSYYVSTKAYRNNASLSTNNRFNLFYQWENFANYSKKIGKGTLSAMAGMSYQRSISNYTSASTDLLVSERPNFRWMSNSSSSANDTVGGEPSENSAISYFGRLGWSYDNRYNIQANFRADAFDSSKLSKDARWGYFPSVSASWNISNERFFKDNVNRDFISSLKLRASWGINGNVNILNNYVYNTSVSSSAASGYDFYGTGESTTGVSISSVLPNPNLRWEESRQIDFGLDARFFKDRLTFTADYYSKNTDGLLTTSIPPLVTGSASTYVNAGVVHNEGLELELGWKSNIGDFTYGISGNVATLKNIVSKGPDTERISGYQPQGLTTVTYFEEGYPIWYIRGWEVDNIGSDGKAYFKTADGGTTATPTADDADYIGDGVPKLTYGLTLTAAYKGIDLTVFGTGAYDYDLLLCCIRPDLATNNRLAYFYHNAGKSLPSAQNQFTQQSYFLQSDLLVFDASFFKIKQIQLGYTLPTKLVKKARISNLRVFASLDDFITFTKYPGFDPETRTSTSGAQMAVDMVQYPISKKVVFGLNLSF